MTQTEGLNAATAPEAHLVMLIEDEAHIREAITYVLEASGYAVKVCEDCSLGIGQLESGLRPDIILLDLLTPRMTGWEFRVIQRRHAAWAAIPTVALTACGSAEAEAIDADAYLTKPVSEHALTDTIRQLLDGRDRAHLEAQLRERERLNSLGMLAAGIAHEVNNPLTFVVGNLDLARRQVALAGRSGSIDFRQLDELLRRAEQGAYRVSEVVRRMAQFARPLKLEQSLVDVTELLESSLQLVKNELRHRARLERRFEPAPMVKANAAQLGQVFLNLLLNAIYALDQRREPGFVRVCVATEGDEAVVTVAHTGASLAGLQPVRLFDPAYPQKHAGVGVGVNLSVSLGYVEELGGTLTVHAGAEGETIFRVALKGESSALAGPSDHLAAVPITARDVEAGRAPPKVLMIDDEKMMCDLVCAHLEETYDVTTSTGGKEALARLRSGEAFDVILCDVMMPAVTGIDLYEALVRDVPDQAARMVFISGGAFTERTRTFFDRPGMAYLQKPFTARELREAVARRLSERGPVAARASTAD